MRQLVTAFIALTAWVAFGAPASQAGVTCSHIPSWCSPPSDPGPGAGDHHHSVPEPGTLGLLAVGAAAGLYRMRRRPKSKD